MTAPREETQIVPVRLPDGSEILAEVIVPHTGGDAGAAGRTFALDGIRDDIARIGGLLADAVQNAFPDPPDKYGVDFGLKLSVESKGLTSVLAKVAGEATVTVRLEWNRPQPGGTGQR